MIDVTVYENAKGETFYRQSDTYGHTGRYDVTKATKAELDQWLAANGFEFVGVDDED
jgi:hypothetical protein